MVGKERKFGFLALWVLLVSVLLICLGGNAYAEEEEGVAPVVAPTATAEDSDAEEGVAQKSLTLAIGVSKTVEFDFDIGPIHLTDPSLLTRQRVPPTGRVRTLLLVPRSPGYTDMVIHDTNGKPRIKYLVRVTREDLGQVIAELNNLLGDIEGIEIKPLGDRVVIDGEIKLPKDMSRIIRVIDAMKDRDAKKAVPIRNLATISKVTMNVLAELIEREIGSPEISVRVVNNTIWLEGVASNNFEADRAEEIAKSYLPEAFVEKSKGEGGEVRPKQEGGNVGGLPTINSMLRIKQAEAPPPEKDIKITMNYVELLNEYDKTFNFSWKPLAQESGNVQYSTALGELSANLVATVSSLFPKLNTAKNHAHARVLKQEQLIVKNGASQPGAIESSIDFYARNVNDRGEASLQPISVQNATRVRGRIIEGSDSIELGIQITLNTLLGTNQGAPIIAKNSLQTQVTIKNGDSAALAGYAVDQALSGYNREPTQRIPGVGETSGGGTPLFNLERSKAYKRQKQQYVIFVTPEVLRTASAGTEDIQRKFRLNAGEY